MNIEKITLSTQELMILEKALYNAKFLCHASNTYRFAANPITGSLLVRIIDVGKDSLTKEGIEVIKSDWHYIDDGKHEDEMFILKKHIQDIDEWSELSYDEKKSIIINLLSPLNYKIETLEQLIIYGNGYHD